MREALSESLTRQEQFREVSEKKLHTLLRENGFWHSRTGSATTVSDLDVSVFRGDRQLKLAKEIPKRGEMSVAAGHILKGLSGVIQHCHGAIVVIQP